MTRIVVIISIALLPAIAHAQHRRCRETSTVVGEQQCSRFGAGWAGVTLGWELGLAMQSLRFDAIDRDVDTQNGRVHVTAESARGVATEVALRDVYNLTEHFHLVTELSFGRLGELPTLTMSPIAREMSPVTADAHGWTIGSLLGAGVHASRSAVTAGVELGVAPRFSVFETDRLPGALFGQGELALEARVHAALWISPHWTIGGLVSSNALSRDEHTVMVAIGLHAFPFDGG